MQRKILYVCNAVCSNRVGVIFKALIEIVFIPVIQGSKLLAKNLPIVIPIFPNVVNGPHIPTKWYYD